MSDELPSVWKFVKLGKITSKVGSGATPRGGSDSYATKGVPLIRSMNVRFEGFTAEGLAFLNKAQAEALDTATVKSADVLLNITGASIGRVTQTPPSMNGARVNQHVCIIRPKPELEPAFLARFLASPAVQRMIWTEQYGVTRQALTKGQILDFDIPLPPLAEQRRIVAKLETLLGKVDACQRRLAKIPRLLKRFRQSVLAAACSGRLTADWRDSTSSEPIVPPVNIGMPEDIDCVEGWAWKKLSDLARLESGHTPRKTIPEYWEGGNVPWICLQDIRAANGKVITETILKPTMHGIDNSSARMLPAGTVVFSRDISVGYVAIMGREMATSQHFADWICGGELNNHFLMYALMASRRHLMSSQQGSTVGTIYMPALKEFHLLKPPLPEQHEIVRRVEQLFTFADQLEARFAKAQAHVDKLTQSLLAKAFRGELVPQDPNDEPASELLRRIDAQTESKSRRDARK